MDEQLSNQGRKVLVREVTKNMVVTLTGLQRAYVEMGETSRRTTMTVTLRTRRKPLLSKRSLQKKHQKDKKQDCPV